MPCTFACLDSVHAEGFNVKLGALKFLSSCPTNSFPPTRFPSGPLQLTPTAEPLKRVLHRSGRGTNQTFQRQKRPDGPLADVAGCLRWPPACPSTGRSSPWTAWPMRGRRTCSPSTRSCARTWRTCKSTWQCWSTPSTDQADRWTRRWVEERNGWLVGWLCG